MAENARDEPMLAASPDATRLDATVPVEAFDPTHPDHAEWVAMAGRCLASVCVEHGRSDDDD